MAALCRGWFAFIIVGDWETSVNAGRLALPHGEIKRQREIIPSAEKHKAQNLLFQIAGGVCGEVSGNKPIDVPVHHRLNIAVFPRGACSAGAP